MEQKQINLENLYEIMQRVEKEIVEIKEEIKNKEIYWDWDDVKVLADEDLLGECWLSKEDEKAFAYLQ